jgi:hypothetical protein
MRDETGTLYAQVHNRVDELLHYIWDPIGVAGVPETRDEYDGYVPTVVKMLLDGSKAPEISAFLEKVVTHSMGITGTPEGSLHSMKVAQRLVEHHAFIRSRKAN